MSEADKGTSTTRVSDRRRFDPEGNPRPEEQEETPQAQAAPEAPPTGEEGAAEPREPSPAEQAAVELARLQEELAAARRRVDELARAYQAVDRDREDFKLRLTRERDGLLEVERGEAARIVLEAVDELDRALAASAQDPSPLAQGVRMIRDSLLARLQASGIERLEVVGRPFDPNTAEAVDMELTASPEEDQQVVAEVRAGYRMKERVLRPARVKVAKYVAPAQA